MKCVKKPKHSGLKKEGADIFQEIDKKDPKISDEEIQKEKEASQKTKGKSFPIEF